MILSWDRVFLNRSEGEVAEQIQVGLVETNKLQAHGKVSGKVPYF